MIRDTLHKLEQQIQQTGALRPEQKEELQRLLLTLKDEVAELSKTDADQARTIAGFTELSAHEATREARNPHLLKLSLEGLSSSVEGFERSHPNLVQIVNSLCTTLSNMGI